MRFKIKINLPKILFLSVMSGLIIVPFLYAKKTVFKETTDSKSLTYQWWKTWNASAREYRISLDHPNEYLHIVCKRNRSTKSWTYKSKVHDTAYTAVRNGNTILLTGKLKGEPVNREYQINTMPWYESITYSLEPFVRSGQKRKSFWVISPIDLRLSVVTATRFEVEEIPINGEKIKAVKVLLTARNVPIMIWKAEYWFRKSNGKFIRYMGKRGGPGTPITTIEYIEEK